MTEGWRPGTVPLTVAEVADLIPNHKVVVVHFWARWNGVDRQFASVLDAVRPEFEGRITFRSADVDDPGSERKSCIRASAVPCSDRIGRATKALESSSG